MGCFQRIKSLKAGFIRLKSVFSRSRSRSRSPDGPIHIGHPTNVQKDADPFASMMNLPENREYLESEKFKGNGTVLGRQLPGTERPSFASSEKANPEESTADIHGEGIGSEELSSTTVLVDARKTEA